MVRTRMDPLVSPRGLNDHTVDTRTLSIEALSHSHSVNVVNADVSYSSYCIDRIDDGRFNGDEVGSSETYVS